MMGRRSDREMMDRIGLWLIAGGLVAIAYGILVWPCIARELSGPNDIGLDFSGVIAFLGPFAMVGLAIVGLAVLLLGAMKRSPTAVGAGLFALVGGAALALLGLVCMGMLCSG